MSATPSPPLSADVALRRTNPCAAAGSPTVVRPERWILALAKHLRPDSRVDVGTIKDAQATCLRCAGGVGHGLRTEVFESPASSASVPFASSTHSSGPMASTSCTRTATNGHPWMARSTRHWLASGINPHDGTRERDKVQIYESLQRLAFYFSMPSFRCPRLYTGCVGSRAAPQAHLISNGVDLTELQTAVAPLRR